MSRGSIVCTLYKCLYTVQMGRREKNLEMRRQRILDATRELIARDGIDGWSMRRLADAADVSVPTLYNLFGSKEDIRAAMCAAAFAEGDGGDSAATSEAPIERVIALVNRGVDKVVAKAHKTRPALLERGFDFRKGPLVVERLRSSVQEAMDSGLLRDDLRADLIVDEGYEGFCRAAVRWAEGHLAADEFRAKALYSTCLSLLAVATDETRTQLLPHLHDLERSLPAGRTSTTA